MEYIVGIVILVLVVSGALFLYFSGGMETVRNPLLDGTPFTEIVDPSGFINTDGITIGELVGEKVIMVDFMTYSCINCQRTFPYAVDWYQKYSDEGLEIIGIHTPEFAFEKDINNVRKAMQGFGITFPIVLDNEYATWRAYGNRYWPRKYLIDIHGNVAYDHIGEGAYQETEKKIQELLRERADVLGISPGPDTGGSVVTDAKVRSFDQSPETYFGALRNSSLANGNNGQVGKQTFTRPNTLSRDKLYLEGMWNIDSEYARSVADSAILFRFRAAHIYIVAGSPDDAVIEVLIDGAPPGEWAGVDVDSLTGEAYISGHQLYDLVSYPEHKSHVIEIRVKSGTLDAFTFTFG